MSSLFCFMDCMGRYHGSKVVPALLVEDGVLGNLAPPGDLEESASHHVDHVRPKSAPEDLARRDSKESIANLKYTHSEVEGTMLGHIDLMIFL